MRNNLSNLNPLEEKIHKTLVDHIDAYDNLTINLAANLTNVSTSKISKFVKKAGFAGYKEYIRFISGKNLIKEKDIGYDLYRIQNFIMNFNHQEIDNLTTLILEHDKIILLGYGPTAICTEYLEYKLNFTINKNVIRISESSLVPSLLDSKTLLLIFSVGGQYAQFDELFIVAEESGAQALLIIEELNPNLTIDKKNVLFLTDSEQSQSLQPHEKSRAIFFIFIEELIKNFI